MTKRKPKHIKTIEEYYNQNLYPNTLPFISVITHFNDRIQELILKYRFELDLNHIQDNDGIKANNNNCQASIANQVLFGVLLEYYNMVHVNKEADIYYNDYLKKFNSLYNNSIDKNYIIKRYLNEFAIDFDRIHEVDYIENKNVYQLVGYGHAIMGLNPIIDKDFIEDFQFFNESSFMDLFNIQTDYRFTRLYITSLDSVVEFQNRLTNFFKGYAQAMFVSHLNSIYPNEINKSTETNISDQNAQAKGNSKNSNSRPTKRLQSFNYINKDNRLKKLEDFMNCLVQNQLINKMNVSDFNKVFMNSSDEVSIIWKGTISELYYLISELHNNKQKVENTKQKQWKITVQFFKMSDGTILTHDLLRGQKKPADTSILDKAINLL